MGIQERHGHVNGLGVAWLESGSGPPIVMLHGLGGDGADTYRPVINHLPDHHCFAPWARGHGKSAWTDGYLIQDYAADAGAFINDVVGEPAVVLGFSLGSMTASYLAIHRPELVSGLFLEDSPLLVLHDASRHEHETYRPLFASVAAARQAMIDHERDFDWFCQQVSSFRVTKPGADSTFGDVLPTEAIQWMASLMVDNDPAVYAPPQTLPTAQLVAALPPEDLASITCPVHLVAGQWKLGGSLPAEDLEEWCRLIPNATTTVIENVGHAIRFAPNGMPEYLRELDEFLARIT